MPIDILIPEANFLLKLSAGETTIFVGANGSGKTRLASWLEENAGGDAHRVSAHRALTLNPSVPKVSQSQSTFRLRSGLDSALIQHRDEKKIRRIGSVIAGKMSQQRIY